MRISVTDDTNAPVWKPMWLMVSGTQRLQLSPHVAYSSYRQRFDIEHMLRFSKQRLLMTHCPLIFCQPSNINNSLATQINQKQGWQKISCKTPVTQFQTPEVEHEENWIRLVMLAYVQLWAAKELGCYLPKPWERSFKPNSDTILTPSTVQRDFTRIISEIGKPGHSPKPRGNSTGRLTGQTQAKRPKHPVLKKGKKSNKPQKQTA